VLLGAVMAGAARRIEERVPVPVLDGMRAAIPLAEALVRVCASAISASTDRTIAA
jgi:allantoin racemase